MATKKNASRVAFGVNPCEKQADVQSRDALDCIALGMPFSAIESDSLNANSLGQSTVNDLPAFTSRNLIDLLWKRAAPHLSGQERQWIGVNASSSVSDSLAAMEEWIGDVGRHLEISDGSGFLKDPSKIAKLLFSISEQVGMLSAVSATDGEVKNACK